MHELTLFSSTRPARQGAPGQKYVGTLSESVAYRFKSASTFVRLFRLRVELTQRDASFSMGLAA